MVRTSCRFAHAIIFGFFGSLAISGPALAQPADACVATYARYDEGPADAVPDAQWASLLQSCTRQADQGDPKAQYVLGEMYRLGRPMVPVADAYKAAELYAKAAAQGDNDARLNLGEAYVDGDGVPLDLMKGLRLIRSAAEGGHPRAQHVLGQMFLKGNKIPQSDADAFEWISKSAGQGDVYAMNSLINLYHEGRGTAVDHQLEMKWARRAAEAGSGVAQYRLGEGYANGHGMEPDLVRGYMWINLAGTQGVGGGSKGPVAEGKRALAELMSPDDVARAQKMSTACFMAEFKGC